MSRTIGEFDKVIARLRTGFSGATRADSLRRKPLTDKELHRRIAIYHAARPSGKRGARLR